MIWNPDNLIFFYLLMAILVLAFSIFYYADTIRNRPRTKK